MIYFNFTTTNPNIVPGSRGTEGENIKIENKAKPRTRVAIQILSREPGY